MLTCDLCKSTNAISHLSIPIHQQEQLLNGKHVHICATCRDGYYSANLINDITKVDNYVLASITSLLPKDN